MEVSLDFDIEVVDWSDDSVRHVGFNVVGRRALSGIIDILNHEVTLLGYTDDISSLHLYNLSFLATWRLENALPSVGDNGSLATL